MPEIQERSVSPPSDELKDFAEVIQGNLLNLHELAHNHLPRTAAPSDDEGQVGDIIGVDDGATFKIFYRFASGWKSVTLT